MKSIGLVLFLLLFVSPLRGWSNGVTVQITSYEPGRVCLTAGWQHAWQATGPAGNGDALWVFLKVRDGNGHFHHLPVSGGSVTVGSAVLTFPSDRAGFFLSMDSGHVGATGLQQYCVDFQPVSGFIPMEVRVYAIEMVHVLPGGFWLGDSVSNGAMSDPAGNPVWVADETSFPATSLQDTGAYKPAGDIPALWPKGTQGFYCMKHEVSMSQYVDFLNTLSADQQAARTAVPLSSAKGTLAMSSFSAARNAIRILSPSSGTQPAVFGLSLDGLLFNDGQQGEHRACNWLNWEDLCAYLDWAALRPMTEWEFEKACRGPRPWVAGEFAWGTDGVVDGNTLLQDGTPNERVAETGDSLQGLTSHGYDGPQGPLRVGFAASDFTGRVKAGATFWGVLDMSGNVWEQCVTVNQQGLTFTGRPGNGQIGTDGKSDEGWPTADGAGFRGGGWNSGVIPGFNDLGVSDRFYAGMPPITRRSTAGGRGCR